MIVKGKSRPAATGLGRYLMRKGKNERVDLKELRGFCSDKIAGAMQEMDAVGGASECEKYVYHASINPALSDHLTPEQMLQAVDILERHLKLEDHQRVIVSHEKDGREHYHIAWNRVDPETMKAVTMSHNYRAHEEAAREIERTFSLEQTQGRHTGGGPKPERGPKQWESERGRRSGVDPRELSKHLKEIWGEALNGQDFQNELESYGYLLARGDSRAFLVVDRNGDLHSLARRLGLKASEVSEGLSDIDRAQIWSAEEAQQIQLERKKEGRAAKLGTTLFDRGDMVSQQQDANRQAADHQKAAEKAFREAQAQARADAPKQEEKAAEKATARQRSAQEQDSQTKAEQQKKAREEQDKRAKAEQQKPQQRGEQTERKQRYSQSEIMQELFRKQFSLPKERKDNSPARSNDWDRERER